MKMIKIGTLRPPTSKELIETFGTVQYMNGRQEVAHDNVEEKVSVLYDLLNGKHLTQIAKFSNVYR
jgi:hypothetical protein